ncbi:MAG: hypothetical protein J5781_01475, partial [Clostridia bacterium]|nr:hypothetical protein [Clostridia bacterium]
MKSKRVSNLVFISVVLIAIISLTFAFGISAGISGRLNAADAAWEGDGAGTSEDPYLIATKEDLLNFRELVNGIYNGSTYEGQNVDVCAKLIEDIDFEGDNSVSWAVAMIAWDSAYPYAGTFDGNGHTISGLHMNYNVQPNLALFGYTGSEAVIKDLTVVGDANCSSGAGIVVQNSGQILRCVNRVELYCEGLGLVGGIVKDNNSTGSIIGCVNEATVKGKSTRYQAPNAFVGGIASVNEGTITDCINNGVIMFVENHNTNSYIGGIAGRNYGEISYCVNNNTVCVEFT